LGLHRFHLALHPRHMQLLLGRRCLSIGLSLLFGLLRSPLLLLMVLDAPRDNRRRSYNCRCARDPTYHTAAPSSYHDFFSSRPQPRNTIARYLAATT
jgi:hypothetical protein